jgi:gliding motility-associated-like protein
MTVGTSYTITATNGFGCTSLSSISFSNAAQLTTPLAPTIQSTPPTCLAAGSSSISNYNNTYTYTFTPSGPSVGAGGVINGMTIGTSYRVTARIAAGCASATSLSFSNAPQLIKPVVNAGPDRNINIGESVQIQGSASGIGISILWSPSGTLSNATIQKPIAKPLVTTKYIINVLSSEGCSAKDSMTVFVYEPIDIPNVFSPNGDGFNDLWIIDKLEQYPNSIVEVFNRYGKKIFERKGYNRSNAWDGTNGGSPLPVAPYYYILRLGDGSKPIAGVISIIR